MNHSRNTNDTTNKTVMEKTYLPGETEPCLVRTAVDKTESIRIVNMDGSERKPSDQRDVVAATAAASSIDHHRTQQQLYAKMTCMEKVGILFFLSFLHVFFCFLRKLNYFLVFPIFCLFVSFIYYSRDFF